MRARAALLALAALAAASCGGPSRVDLGLDWPERSPSYEVAYERWTRHAVGRSNVDLAIDAWATLKSAEWRSAYIARTSRRLLMSPDARASLEAQERDAARKEWEVELIVATHEYAWNDLTRRGRSIWRLALATDDGREVLPTRVQEDRRPRGEIASWFPSLGPFHKAYVVTFPATTADGTPLVGDGTKALVLKVGSSLASVRMVWHRR